MFVSLLSKSHSGFCVDKWMLHSGATTFMFKHTNKHVLWNGMYMCVSGCVCVNRTTVPYFHAYGRENCLKVFAANRLNLI